MKLDKELGQHFLSNKGIVEKIIRRIEAFGHKELIEIGSGGGALTGDLLAHGYKVLAIEFDQRWYEELQKKFRPQVESGQFQILHSDATRTNLDEIQALLKSEQVTLCGNLPYNRGQEIVFRFFENASFVDSFVVMLQKEVVDKFLPKHTRKLYGPLSIKMNFLAQNLDSFFVSPGSFSPPPKVDSAVLSFQRTHHEFDPIVDRKSYDAFSKLLHRAFLQRRKKLSNNLDKIPAKFEHFESKRAEELSPEEFLALYKSTVQS